MTKIMTIIGTRPEIIKMSCLMEELDRHFEHIIVHTGQNYDYELNDIFFKNLKVRKPDYFLNAAGKTTASSIGNIISKSDKVIKKEKPDAILLYGDTNSCLSVISAKRRKIPIFHFEAGNRCFDQRVPEEINRKIVDHLSDINFVLTEHARRYLIMEGIRPETIFKTGSHMPEVINKFRNKIEKSTALKANKLKRNNYFLASIHREENVDNMKNLNNIINALNRLTDEYSIPIIISTHPRTRKVLSNKSLKNKFIKFSKPFGFFDYMKLQLNSRCVISDSGTITEESSILSFPAINVRNSHERPEGMDEGSVIMTGTAPDRILESVKITMDHHKDKKSYSTIDDYGSEKVSKKIVRVIISYIDSINRNVWKKRMLKKTLPKSYMVY